MKNGGIVIAVILVIGLVIAIVISNQPTAYEKALDALFNNTDPEIVDRAKKAMDSVGIDMAKEEARAKGDTYCSSCSKVNPGKVRICTYCGQYIK